MWYIAAVAGIVVAGALAGVIRSKGIDLSREGLLNDLIDSGSIGSLSMEQVNFLLARLESEEPPESMFGAMCYAPMALPLAAEYICPTCGEKTLYGSDQAAFIQMQLSHARRLAESISASAEFNIVLDESLFCDFCSEEKTDSPTLLLRVTTGDGSEVVSTVTVDDLRMLDSFLKGNLYWVTSNDGQFPLRDHASRIAELLGIGYGLE